MNRSYVFNERLSSATCVSALFGVLLQTMALGACDEDKPEATNLNFEDERGFDASVTRSDASKPPETDASTGPITPSQTLAYQQEILDAYDRYLNITCECWVVNQLYESFDQCYSVMGFNSELVECATQAMQDFNSPELRVLIDCLFETLESLFECYEVSECELEAIAVCPIPEQCFVTMQSESIVKVIESCPELGLLSGFSP